MVYKWYILPIGGLYITYQLLREPETTIDVVCVLGGKCEKQPTLVEVKGSGRLKFSRLPFQCFFFFFFSQKHRRCLGSRLGDYGRSERECPDPVDGRWTGCGRAGAAEIAWEEARDGGARANVRIRWTGGGRAVDGRELQK